MTPTFTIKQGDTFSIGGPVLCPSGVWSAAAAWRDVHGRKVADCTVTLTPITTPTDTQTHAILITLAASIVATLPVGSYTSDLKLSDGVGNVVHTDSYAIILKPSETP